MREQAPVTSVDGRARSGTTPGRVQAPLLQSSSAPDLVELVLIERQQPALRYQPIADVEYPDGSPATKLAADGRFSIGKVNNPIGVREHSARRDAEAVVGDLAPHGEVPEYLLEPAVLASDRAPSGNVPHDIFGEQTAQVRADVLPGVEAALDCVEPLDEPGVGMVQNAPTHNRHSAPATG
jgi:hypothetical protein